MPNEINRNYPYPGVNDAPDGPLGIQRLAEAAGLDVKGVEARVTAAEQVVIARADRTATGSDVTFGPTANVNLVSMTITGARAGIYRIEGHGGFKSTAATNGSMYVTAGSRTAYFRHDLNTVWQPGHAYIADYVHAGGNLTITFGYDCPVGSAVLANPTTKQPCYIQAQYTGKTSVTA